MNSSTAVILLKLECTIAEGVFHQMNSIWTGASHCGNDQ